MRIGIYFPGLCQNCGKSVSLKETKCGKEDIPGGYRILLLCPYCGHEIHDKVGPVDDKGNPIPPNSKGD